MEIAISLAAKDKPFRQQFPLHLTFFLWFLCYWYFRRPTHRQGTSGSLGQRYFISVCVFAWCTPIVSSLEMSKISFLHAKSAGPFPKWSEWGTQIMCTFVDMQRGHGFSLFDPDIPFLLNDIIFISDNKIFYFFSIGFFPQICQSARLT